MSYRVIKTYGNDTGLSCAFRQWKADSHCNLIHGYALGFEITFESKTLNDKNWVIDFGDLGVLKDFLKKSFDHTTAVAEDDPNLIEFTNLEKSGMINLFIMKNVGCEAFAQLVYDFCSTTYDDDRVKVVSVRCFEHGANSAVFGNF
jgi:6-pyruvoyltetrahydropterin/6-carboxytetrahydropterin synthase